jgi:hypothetical protein
MPNGCSRPVALAAQTNRVFSCNYSLFRRARASIIKHQKQSPFALLASRSDLRCMKDCDDKSLHQVKLTKLQIRFAQSGFELQQRGNYSFEPGKN